MTFRRERMAMVFEPRDMMLNAMQPFGDVPIVTVSRNGRWLAIVRRDAPVSSPSTVSVELRDLESGRTRTTRHPFEPVPLTAQVVDSAVTELIRPYKQFPWARDSIRAKLYRPRFRPPVQAAFVEDGGRVWLRETVPEGTTRTVWRIVEPDGGVGVRVSVPGGVRVLAAQENRVLAAVVDADDVPVLARYLIPATAGGAR
ncbi:MAG: hypothetical protein IPK12_03355 [Gemmatimonadetes bacterium]|nr:hypothetical protein [Gemmatimonadota bacterium]